MLTNQVISWRRKWGRIQPRPDRDLDRTVDDPTDAVDRRDALLRSLSSLPARQRAAIVRYASPLTRRLAILGHITEDTDDTERQKFLQVVPAPARWIQAHRPPAVRS